MTSTACDDQYVTITPATGSSNSYGAVPPLGAGAIGATGSFTIPSGTLSIANPHTWGTLSSTSSYASNVTMSTSILSIMAEGDGDAMIKTKKHDINLDEMADTIEILKQRLLVLTPNFKLHEHYPALKEAYEHYKVLEAMLAADDK